MSFGKHPTSSPKLNCIILAYQYQTQTLHISINIMELHQAS